VARTRSGVICGALQNLCLNHIHYVTLKSCALCAKIRLASYVAGTTNLNDRFASVTREAPALAMCKWVQRLTNFVGRLGSIHLDARLLASVHNQAQHIVGILQHAPAQQHLIGRHRHAFLYRDTAISLLHVCEPILSSSAMEVWICDRERSNATMKLDMKHHSLLNKHHFQLTSSIPLELLQCSIDLLIERPVIEASLSLLSMNVLHRGCTFIARLVHEAPLELVQVCIGLFTLQGGVYI